MAQPKTKTYVTVRINTELLTAVDALAKTVGRTRTDVIEEGLRWMESRLRSQVARIAQNEAEKER